MAVDHRLAAAEPFAAEGQDHQEDKRTVMPRPPPLSRAALGQRERVPTFDSAVPDAVKVCWVLTEGSSPFRIHAASKSWHVMWQFSPAESVGQSVSILNGPGHDAIAGKEVMARLERDGCDGVARCRNVTKSGVCLSHDLYIVRHTIGFLAVSTNVSRDLGNSNCDSGMAAPPPRPPASVLRQVFYESAQASQLI